MRSKHRDILHYAQHLVSISDDRTATTHAEGQVGKAEAAGIKAGFKHGWLAGADEYAAWLGDEIARLGICAECINRTGDSRGEMHPTCQQAQHISIFVTSNVPTRMPPG